MSYLLSHLLDTPFARTIVISDSEYKALAKAKAEEQIQRLEARVRAYENAAEDYRKEIAYIKEQVGLLPETKDEQTTETVSES